MKTINDLDASETETNAGQPITDANRKRLYARSMAELVYRQTEIIREAQRDINARVERYRDEPEFWSVVDGLGIRHRLDEKIL